MADFERNLVSDEACTGGGGGYEVRLQFGSKSLAPKRFSIGSEPLDTSSYETIVERLRAEQAGVRTEDLVSIEAWRLCQRAHIIGGERIGAWRSRLERYFAGFVADSDGVMEVPSDAVRRSSNEMVHYATLQYAVGSFSTSTRVILHQRTPFERDNLTTSLIAPAYVSRTIRPILVGLVTGQERMLTPAA